MLQLIKKLHYNKKLLNVCIGLAVITIAVLSLSSLEKIPKEFTFKFQDKIGHFMMYGGLQGLLLIRFLEKKSINKTILLGSIALLYSMLIEVLQANLPVNRTGDWFDVMANFIGIFATSIIFHKWYCNYFTSA